MMQEDPNSASPVLSMATYIQSLLNGRKLSDIKEGSKDWKFLQSRIGTLISDATHSMTENTKTIQDVVQQKASKLASSPKAAKTLTAIAQKIKKEAADARVTLTPEKLDAAVKAEYAKRNVEGAVRAEAAR